MAPRNWGWSLVILFILTGLFGTSCDRLNKESVKNALLARQPTIVRGICRKARALVELYRDGKLLQRVRTNEKGEFAFTVEQPGQYIARALTDDPTANVLPDVRSFTVQASTEKVEIGVLLDIATPTETPTASPVNQPVSSPNDSPAHPHPSPEGHDGSNSQRAITTSPTPTSHPDPVPVPVAPPPTVPTDANPPVPSEQRSVPTISLPIPMPTEIKITITLPSPLPTLPPIPPELVRPIPMPQPTWCPTHTPYPTIAPYPTTTPYPTYTPMPTATVVPTPTPTAVPTPTPDYSAPTGATIVIAGGASLITARDVNVTISAQDNIGVVAYYLSEEYRSGGSTDIPWVSVESTPSLTRSVPFTLSVGDGEKRAFVRFKDASGNVSAMATDTIMVDTTPPHVITSGVSPAMGAANVPINATIVIPFSEDVDEPSVTNTTIKLTSNSGEVVGALSYNARTHIVTLAPYSHLARGTQYTITVTAGVKDKIGNASVGEFTTTFTTRVAPAFVTGGDAHTLLIDANNQLWSVGDNWQGQLADGTTISPRRIPILVQGLGPVKTVLGGLGMTLVLMQDGTVWAWGSNEKGRLGDGTTTNRSIPAPVSGLSGITAIALAPHGYHVMALKDDGTVWAWGYNRHGQLGDGSKIDRYLPVQVQGLTDVVQIAAGAFHSFAIKRDGTVWTWGSNGYGQLGDGTYNEKELPVLLEGLTGVKMIVGGWLHTVILKEDGTVWACGTNSWGSVGSGSYNRRINRPIQVPGLAGITLIATGVYHSLALKNDGTVWAWGFGEYGQLGNGLSYTSYSPVQVMGINDARGIAIGSYHSFAIRSDGSIWGWGTNGQGQLGDGESVPGGRRNPAMAVLF